MGFSPYFFLFDNLKLSQKVPELLDTLDFHFSSYGEQNKETMHVKMLLGLAAVTVVLLWVEPGVNGLTAEQERQHPVEATAQLPHLLNEEDDDANASASGTDGSDSDDNEVVEDSDTSADCRPGTSNWPACRSVGYPGCMPGVVRWPQCKTDPTRG